VAFDEAAAQATAARLSIGGEQFDVTYVPADGAPRVTASFLDGQPVTAGPAAAAESGPAALPAAAPASAGAVPAGLTPLSAATASGSLHRPHRLVYPGGTRVTCRPTGRFGPSWTGTAAGVAPAPGESSGWLQAVRRDDGEVVTVHPAAVTPDGVNPYALLSFRAQQRFSGFDQAEAAGRDAAFTYAVLVDEGDQVRIEVPPRSGRIDIREVTSVRTVGARVWISTVSLGGEERSDPYASRDRIEVMLPGWHPAEDGPDAARLFAPRPYQIRPGGAPDPVPAEAEAVAGRPEAGQIAELAGRLAAVERELARLREAATAGPGTWQASLSMGEALGRARPPAPGPADPHGWGAAAGDARDLLAAQETTRQAVTGLADDPAWQRLGRATRGAHRLAADAGSGQLRFSDPARASRAWREIWAQVCEITGDMAGALMPLLRQGSRSWRAARRLRHAAAEASAHAHGWLPRGQRLPPGSYAAGVPTMRAAADAATRARGQEPPGQPPAPVGTAAPSSGPGVAPRGQDPGPRGPLSTVEFPAGRHAGPRPGTRAPGRHAAPRPRRATRLAPPPPARR